MPARPYLKSVELNNFRGTRNLKVEGLRRINLIGGLNGSGKTTLLEAVFMTMDRLSPAAIIRPLGWRNLPATVGLAHETYFSSSGEQFDFKIKTRDGDFTYVFKWERQTLSVDTVVSTTDQLVSAETKQNLQGITLEVKRGGQLIQRRRFFDLENELAVRDDIPFSETLPSATYLSRYTSHYPKDLADRFTTAVHKKLRKQLVALARRVAPSISDLQILQIRDQGILHAEFADGSVVPLSFAGDGALSIVSIALAMFVNPGGMLLLDEFDAAVHYGKLSDIWRAIFELSEEYGVQIIAATHSRESIDAAVAAMSTGHQSDIAYFRLDRLEDKTVATSYLYDQLALADSEDWEIR